MTSLSSRVRERLSGLCFDAASAIYEWGISLDPGPQGEPCPDCGVPTTVPKDQECPECRDRWEAKKRDEALHGAAYEEGYQAAERARQSEGSW